MSAAPSKGGGLLDRIGVAGDALPSNPTTGIAGCCARAASGHAAAPPSSVMNSRRLMLNTGVLPTGNNHQQPTVTGRCETSSRMITYEKCLQHAAFLGVDLVSTIEAVIASQPFHRRRGREHAIGLTGRLEARGDVDGIAPDVVGEPARADDPCHDRAGMQAHPDRKRGRQP